MRLPWQALRCAWTVLLFLQWTCTLSAFAQATPQVPETGFDEDTESGEPIDARATLFGFAVCALGDLDGDAVEDFAVGAPVAYGEHGRRGCVLVFSGKSLEVLQELQSSELDDWHGGSMLRLDDLDGDGACELAIAPLTFFGGHEDTRVGIVSPKTGKVLARLRGYQRCVGVLPDRNGDGFRELLLAPVPKPEERFRAIDSVVVSGKSFEPIGPSPVPNCTKILLADVDGDGADDYATYTEEVPGIVRLRSAIDGREIRKLELSLSGKGIPSWAFRCVSTDFDADGRSDLVMTASREDATFTSLRGFPAHGGPGPGKIVLERFQRFTIDNEPARVSLFAAGDLDLDGAGDVLAANREGGSAIEAHSVLTGRRLWITARPDTDDADAAFARLPDRDGDGVPEILHGSVSYIWNGPCFGEDGFVEILSGRTGSRLAHIPESKVHERIGPRPASAKSK